MQIQAFASAQPRVRAIQEAVASAAARAVRPLAASARPERVDAIAGLCTEPAFSSQETTCWVAHRFVVRANGPMFGKARISLSEVTACSVQRQALRRSAKPNARGRAATSFARGGGFGLFAGGVTQRTMRAGSAPHAMPNPSIERDVQELSLLAAPHVKR
jgi:hypothetical protein